MQKENLPIFAIFQTAPVKDLDAGILRIEYNSLNLKTNEFILFCARFSLSLPSMIRFSDHSKHVYAYDATGKNCENK